MTGRLCTLITTGGMACLLLFGCQDSDDQTQQPAATPPAVTNSSDDASRQEPVVEQDAAQVDEAASEEETDNSADTASTQQAEGETGDKILDRHWQETIIEFRNPIAMNMELKNAVFNDAEGADMSILSFEASCRVGRHDWLYKDIVMDSLKDTDSATLELDICSVEMMPLLQNPVATGRTSTGGTTLSMNGGLKFIVRDPDGNVMGTFVVNSDGEIDEAEQGELYSWRISETDNAMMPAEYLFYRTPGRGDSIHYEFGVSYTNSTVARKVVKDPLGHEITYFFPNGTINVVPPNPPKREDPNEFRRN